MERTPANIAPLARPLISDQLWFKLRRTGVDLPLGHKPLKEESTTRQIEGPRERVNTADGDNKMPWLL